MEENVMRVRFIEVEYNTLIYIIADKVEYYYNANKIMITSNLGYTYTSRDQISYEEYLKLTANLIHYGVLDLHDMIFECE